MGGLPDGDAAGSGVQVYGSIDRWRRVFGDETECRRLFERWRWPLGAFCPYCESRKVWRLKDGGRKGARRRQPGLWECGDCQTQFTCTTGTPLHGAKLRLGKWLEAFYLLLGSSKGLSSVVLARHIGVTQTTAWRMGHALREMLQDRPDLAHLLDGEVEADSLYVGGAPEKTKHVWNPRGKGTSKQQVLVAKQRKGPVVAQVFEGNAAKDIRPVMDRHVAKTASLMTDGDAVMAKIAKDYAEHHPVNHSQKVWSFDGYNVNSAEAYNLLIRRAMMGVYHRLSEKHMQRYLDELSFRWNQRETVQRVYKTDVRRGRPPGRRTKAGKPQWVVSVRPFEDQMADLLRHSHDRQIRWDRATGGLRWPERKLGKRVADEAATSPESTAPAAPESCGQEPIDDDYIPF